jgi:hypothetical protein
MFLYLISLILLTYFASQVYTRDEDLFIVLVAIQNGGGNIIYYCRSYSTAGRRRQEERGKETTATTTYESSLSLNFRSRNLIAVWSISWSN